MNKTTPLTPKQSNQLDKLELPPQPRILAQIEKLIREPNLNIRTIAALVDEDTGLSSLIFRVINSSYYALQTKIVSVRQAIALIGLEHTLNIIRSEALRRATGGIHPHAAKRIDTRATDIAKLCSIIAAERLAVCQVTPDEAYLAGQFHDCGVPILMKRFPTYCSSLASTYGSGWPDLLQEDRDHELDHCLIGNLLAKKWGLPHAVSQTILHHHDISQVDPESAPLVAILQMATHLYNQMNHNSDLEWESTKLTTLDLLELEQEETKAWEQEIIEAFHEQKA